MCASFGSNGKHRNSSTFQYVHACDDCKCISIAAAGENSLYGSSYFTNKADFGIIY